MNEQKFEKILEIIYRIMLYVGIFIILAYLVMGIVVYASLRMINPPPQELEKEENQHSLVMT